MLWKRLGLVLVGLLVIGAIALSMVYFKVEGKRNDRVFVKFMMFDLPTDEASIAEGGRLVQVKGCMDCHGPDLGGRTFINDPKIGVISGSNLTMGQGSAIADYNDEDWVRAIRYAVGKDGHPLIFMPSPDFHGMSNEDLGRIIAYLKRVPAVDRPRTAIKIGPLGRILYVAGKFPLLFPYEQVNLWTIPVEKVAVEPTAAYGKYLSQACTGCHGEGFSGGAIPGVPPNWPKAANLTPSGRVGKWSFEEFKGALTQGVTPDGHRIDPQFMPWKGLQAMNDVELQALHKFIRELPARTPGTR